MFCRLLVFLKSVISRLADCTALDDLDGLTSSQHAGLADRLFRSPEVLKSSYFRDQKLRR